MPAIVPAPWILNGNGFALLYHFPKKFNKQWGFMKDFQRRGYKGWLGAVMVMNYTHSSIGPYQELLFIPGIVRQSGRWHFTVSKIYVSTEISQLNGQQNWGLPKELAHFELRHQTDGSTSLKVDKEGELVFKVEIDKPKSSIPFNTRLVPLSRLVQARAQELLFTRPTASGHFGLTTLKSISANAPFFPPVQQRKPLLALSLRNFVMQFPLASAEPLLS